MAESQRVNKVETEVDIGVTVSVARRTADSVSSCLIRWSSNELGSLTPLTWDLLPRPQPTLRVYTRFSEYHCKPAN